MKQRAHGRLNGLWREWRAFVLFIAVMLVFRSAIADWNQVPTGSMVPSIYVGDRIVVDKLAYDLRIPFTTHSVIKLDEPTRGDVVTFLSPKDQRLLVKRIVAVPGDEVELKDNVLSINGETASYETLGTEHLEDLTQSKSGRYEFLTERILGDERRIMLSRGHYASAYSSYGPVVVPAGAYFVLGDNRDNSQDSRVIEFVDRSRILGRAESVAFSLDYDNFYRPRLDRFFTTLP